MNGVRTNHSRVSIMTTPRCPGFAPDIFYDRDACPVRGVLQAYGGKWPALALMHLSFGTHRFSELRGAIPDISQRMLTQTLRGLQRDGMIIRTATASVPPRVDYKLTERGRSYLPVLEAALHWAAHAKPAIEASREAYDLKDAQTLQTLKTRIAG